ncbi:MAG: ion transporter [Acidobacteriota bacterium]|nr:ion transporter [Acidobacteriota bacterium]
MSALIVLLHAAFHQPDSRAYRYVQGAVSALILLSVLLLVVEVVLPADSAALALVEGADRVLLMVFAVEIAIRVASYRPPSLRVFRHPPMGHLKTHVVGRFLYLLRPLMLVDLMAVLALFPELRGLRALRLLRLLRSIRVFRYRNPFAIVLQSFEENGLLFALAFTVLGSVTILGGVSIYLVEVRVNEGIVTLLDGVWWSLVTTTTVGYGDIAPVTGLGRTIGAALMVAGMFTLALFAGIVGSSLVTGVVSIREEQFRMGDYVNHIVVCGYDRSTHLMLEALADELDLGETRVVLFDIHERPREVPPEFLWVRGDPTKESELDKVRLTHASAVIVTGERDTSPQAADARTILITFTIRSYLTRYRTQLSRRRYGLYVVVEILDSENVDHARMAGADEVIETSRIGYSMIAHSVGYHGTATAMSRVLLSGAHNVYIGVLPRVGKDQETFGDLLAELQLSKRGGLVVGIRTADGREVINPPKSFVVEPDMQLLYLAEEPLLDPPG